MKKFFRGVLIFVAGGVCVWLSQRVFPYIDTAIQHKEDSFFHQMGVFQNLHHGTIIAILENDSGIHLVQVQGSAGPPRGAIVVGGCVVGQKVKLYTTTVRFSDAIEPAMVLIAKPIAPLSR